VEVSTSLFYIGDLGPPLAKRGRAELSPTSPRSNQDGGAMGRSDSSPRSLEAVMAVSEAEISRIKVSYNEDL
jgi:hypothetical protein